MIYCLANHFYENNHKYECTIDEIYDWAKTNTYGCRYLNYFNLEDGGILTTLDNTPKSLERLKQRASEANREK